MESYLPLYVLSSVQSNRFNWILKKYNYNVRAVSNIEFQSYHCMASLHYTRMQSNYQSNCDFYRKKKYDMQILKMTWKIDYFDISVKKSKRGIGSQVSNKNGVMWKQSWLKVHFKTTKIMFLTPPPHRLNKVKQLLINSYGDIDLKVMFKQQLNSTYGNMSVMVKHHLN